MNEEQRRYLHKLVIDYTGGNLPEWEFVLLVEEVFDEIAKQDVFAYLRFKGIEIDEFK